MSKRTAISEETGINIHSFALSKIIFHSLLFSEPISEFRMVMGVIGGKIENELLIVYKSFDNRIKELLELFFKLDEPYEKTGQYKIGITSIEGLTYFNFKWFLYYGCADSLVGVAIWDPIQTQITSLKHRF